MGPPFNGFYLGYPTNHGKKLALDSSKTCCYWMSMFHPMNNHYEATLCKKATLKNKTCEEWRHQHIRTPKSLKAMNPKRRGVLRNLFLCTPGAAGGWQAGGCCLDGVLFLLVSDFFLKQPESFRAKIVSPPTKVTSGFKGFKLNKNPRKGF